MKDKLQYLLVAGAMLCTPGLAFGASLDVSGQPVTVIFQPGTYLEFQSTFAKTDFSGIAPDGVATNEAGGDPTFFGAAFKAELNEQLSFALQFGEPWAGSAHYTNPGFYQGAALTADSKALTGILRYKFTDRWSAIAGLKYEGYKSEINMPNLPSPSGVVGYTQSAPMDYELGWLVGGAYEIPEMGIRFSLVYSSKVEHTFDGLENGAPSRFSLAQPASLNFDFQVPVSQRDLVFGGIRWVEWSEGGGQPPVYGQQFGGPLSDLSDTIMYTLGIAHGFNERWSGLAYVSHEPSVGSEIDILNPYDGQTALGVGFNYAAANKVNYQVMATNVWLKDSDGGAGVFEDNSAFAVNFKVSYQF